MGNIHFGVPHELALRLRDAFNIKAFVETGTYKAGTATWAAAHFDKVYTIEGYPAYYEANVKAHSGKIPNIQFIFGDSRNELPKVLAKLKKPALIWLDAHWLGNSEESSGTDGECPIREEIAALQACKVQHIILIDDLHVFNGDLPRMAVRALWPDFRDLKKLLARPGYFTETTDDIIISAPIEAKPLIDEYMRNPGMNILVLTSNKYVNILPGFAHFMDKFWPDERQPVTVMRYDVRPPKLPQRYATPAVGKQADFSWSAGLLAHLSNFHGSHVLLMLEDYYLTQPVDRELIGKLWEWMIDHPNVAKLDLSGDRLKTPYTPAEMVHGVQLIESAPDAPFQASLQAAIWRRDFLMDCLVPGETPWEFEKRGTRRIMANAHPRILGTSPALLHYVNAVGGEGRAPGVYDTRKMPPWMIEELRGLGWL
jgi:hypothetical protein